MGLSVFSAFVVAFLVVFDGIQEGYVEVEAYPKNYISWDDMKLDVHKAGLDIREFNYERSRVIVVDKNGEGDCLTVQGAVDMVPEHNTERVKIYIHPGIYREKVFVPSSKPYISFIGSQNQPSDTIITWNNKASDKDQNGAQLGTYRSASVAIESNYFCATGITFENTVVAVPGGYGMQAVALRVAGDKAVFYRVKILGAQDTLLDDIGSHYFYNCHIQGSVDFIFGTSTSLYQLEWVLGNRTVSFNQLLKIGEQLRPITGDSPNDNTGFSFVNCTIIGTGNIFLGRAWGNYSRVVYSYCNMENIIISPGWSDWKQPSRQKTVVFGEYQCRGRGADTSGRVPWSKSFSNEEVRPFLDKKFISGEQWLRL